MFAMYAIINTLFLTIWKTYKNIKNELPQEAWMLPKKMFEFLQQFTYFNGNCQSSLLFRLLFFEFVDLQILVL